MSHKWLQSGILVILCVLTWIWFTQVNRWRPMSDELLHNNRFEAGLNGWQVRGDGDVHVENTADSRDNPSHRLMLNTTGQHSIRLFQVHQLKRPSTGVRARFTLRTKDVQPGNRPWHRFLAMVIPVDEDNRRIPHIHVPPVLISGTTSTQAYQVVTRIPDEITRVRFQLGIHRTTGTVWVDDLMMDQVAVAPWFTAIHVAFVAAWGLLGFWWFWPMRKQLKLSPRWILFITTLTMLFVALLLPPHVIQSITETAPGLKTTWSSEIAHLVMFMAVTVSGFVAFSDTHVYRHLNQLCALALVTEILQTMTTYRTAQLKDFALNIGGIAIGTIVYLIGVRLKRIVATSEHRRG